MEILHIFSVTGNKNRKIWQEMEVGAEKMPPAAGARAFFDAAGRRGRRPLQWQAVNFPAMADVRKKVIPPGTIATL